MIYFILILPLLIAGLVRVAVDQQKILAYPLDCGLSWNKSALIGKSKTWGGVIILTLVAGIVGIALIYSIPRSVEKVALPVYYGFLMGLWYTLGEIINSFIKRRLGVGEGESIRNAAWAAVQYIIDQADSFISLFILGIILEIPWWINGSVFFIAVLLHCIVDAINHILGSKRKADKYALHCFYQVISFWVLKPFSLLIKGKLQFHSFSRPFILTSNHLGWNDAFMFLAVTPWQEFLKFAPFKILIKDQEFRHWYGFYLYLIGGIESRWIDFFEGRPLDRLEQSIKEGFSIIIFYEGRISNTKRPSETLRSGLFKLKLGHPKAPLILAKINKSQSLWSVEQKEIIQTEFPVTKLEFNTVINDTIYD